MGRGLWSLHDERNGGQGGKIREETDTMDGNLVSRNHLDLRRAPSWFLPSEPGLEGRTCSVDQPTTSQTHCEELPGVRGSGGPSRLFTSRRSELVPAENAHVFLPVSPPSDFLLGRVSGTSGISEHVEKEENQDHMCVSNHSFSSGK